MSAVKQKGNKSTELKIVRLFRQHRITGWRRGTLMFGKPDFVFRADGVVVFVDGCFWHNCPKHGEKPRTNRAFWAQKLARNALRDRIVNRTLRREGWLVLRIWQHELSNHNESRLVSRIRQALATKK